jgi:UDP-N-acetylmuramate--alanine ligase
MNLPNHTHVFFIGIGGAGMSALAGLLHGHGVNVAGYDRSPGIMTDKLSHLGIQIVFEDSINQIPAAWNCPTTLVVYTPAIPTNSVLLNYFANGGNRVMKRAQLMGELLKETQILAIAGTHGKTTTSALLIHLLNASKIPANALIGGYSINIDGNFQSIPFARFTVAEADEFDRSFLTLKPFVAVFNSLDADHLDIYGTEEELRKNYFYFADTVRKDGFILTAPGIEIPPVHPSIFSFGTENSPCFARNIRSAEGKTYFTLIYNQETQGDFQLPMLGRHNVNNALAALAVCLKLGASISDLKYGLAQFKGVFRRMQLHVCRPEHIYYDDYAHHPTEIDAAVLALREAYPGRRLLGVFQPHLFSRTQDFWSDFQKSLSAFDELILLEVYPAREKAISGVSSLELGRGISGIKVHNATHSSLMLTLKTILQKGDVVLSIGAGDIDKHCSEMSNHLNQIQYAELA